MARFADREKARRLRAQGRSYSQIRGLIDVSKSTLSVWLADMPLSSERIRLLRDVNPRRIERFRETMRRKREARLKVAYDKARADVGKLSERELFIAGLYLYWGEGTKSDKGAITIANTDPQVLQAFMEWCTVLGIQKQNLRVRLHLYSDMDIKKETKFWSRILALPADQFRKPYIKTSTLAGLSYKNGHGHGTCNVRFENMAMWEYIMMALKYIRETHATPIAQW